MGASLDSLNNVANIVNFNLRWIPWPTNILQSRKRNKRNRKLDTITQVTWVYICFFTCQSQREKCIEPTLLFVKSSGHRPWRCGIPFQKQLGCKSCFIPCYCGKFNKVKAHSPGGPNENIVQNHLHCQPLSMSYLQGR